MLLSWSCYCMPVETTQEGSYPPASRSSRARARCRWAQASGSSTTCRMSTFALSSSPLLSPPPSDDALPSRHTTMGEPCTSPPAGSGTLVAPYRLPRQQRYCPGALAPAAPRRTASASPEDAGRAGPERKWGTSARRRESEHAWLEYQEQSRHARETEMNAHLGRGGSRGSHEAVSWRFYGGG